MVESWVERGESKGVTLSKDGLGLREMYKYLNCTEVVRRTWNWSPGEPSVFIYSRATT